MSDEYLITVSQNPESEKPIPDLETAQQDLINALATWAYVKYGKEFPAMHKTIRVPKALAEKICTELGHLVFRILPSVAILKHHIEAERKGH
jgi:hypothetical protein